ncbi:YgiT-type zinc finger protein [Phormidium pseudopriestleyi FRX01]|uniref:YgiT-type zinc finger protein n=1 Tax=Phormidium pseudopriestleyi FRX01 TaxID=1759528 RepID=A0ABS3FZ93_9CYAN|nr:YgiT-type zinc finger protein [Phormidium pseudopriestleyi]MBO0352058.1 YgiT-type zinc finger protein [Phormidium pseudopriestleyi FRX01]
MTDDFFQETLIAKKVTYTLEVNGKFFMIENVPARVCEETGESFFSPETVERIQQMIWGQKKPKRVIETPVYEFSTSS